MPQITFVGSTGEANIVTGEDGETLMRTALDAGISGVEGECGGSLSCATCHLYIGDDWLSRLMPPSEEEEVMLEFAEGAKANSRLSCQIRLTSNLDGLVVHVPG